MRTPLFQKLIFNVFSITFIQCLLALNSTVVASISPIKPAHLLISEKDGFELYSMNQLDLSSVPLNDKLELGAKIPESLQQRINVFFENVAGMDVINPFNPKDLDITAEFYFFNNDQWVGPLRAFGFYYEEFERTNYNWKNQNNPINFRIRYTPRLEGKWRCNLSFKIKGGEVIQFDPFQFDVRPSEFLDFTRVADNKRYFAIGNEPYFPVGQNLPWPGKQMDNYQANMLPPDRYRDYHKWIDDIADAGANYFRMLLYPLSIGLEYEVIGNYQDRMHQAWEVDQILEKVRDIEVSSGKPFRIHFNMQVHNTLEMISPNTIRDWDWADKSSYTDECQVPSDVGNGYKNQFGFATPKEFMNSATGREYYKMRTRYIVARWGYSTQINLFELISEMNNVGHAAYLEFDPSIGGCVVMNHEKSYYPYLDDPDYPALVNDFQNDICGYIKHDLDEVNHMLALSYTGTPNMPDNDYKTAGCQVVAGDRSYYSPDVDVWTFNHYGLSPEKYARDAAFNFRYNPPAESDYLGNEYAFDKPLIYSEYGLAHCDSGLTWLKSLVLTPFTGSASTALMWRLNNVDIGMNARQLAERDAVWKVFKFVEAFFDGVPLHEDWSFGVEERRDKKADMLYVKSTGSSDYRAAIGVVHNRTVNFYTKGDGKGDCYLSEGSLSGFNDVYEKAIPVNANSGFGNALKIPNMGSAKKYNVRWYNPLSGKEMDIKTKRSDLFGNLRIDYPDLKESIDGSMLYFKVYSSDEQDIAPANDPSKSFSAREVLLPFFSEAAK